FWRTKGERRSRASRRSRWRISAVSGSSQWWSSSQQSSRCDQSWRVGRYFAERNRNVEHRRCLEHLARRRRNGFAITVQELYLRAAAKRRHHRLLRRHDRKAALSATNRRWWRILVVSLGRRRQGLLS